VKIRNAIEADLAAVEGLLAENDLPLDGVRDNFSTFIVAEERGNVVGGVGAELFGSTALLRSAVVSRDYRNEGVGRQLIEQLLERIARAGIEDVYLLTTTAEDYFLRFGFTRASRTAVPAVLKSSAEFQGACPESAVVMARAYHQKRNPVREDKANRVRGKQTE